MTDFITKDSGKRQEFASGAVRDTVEGKPRYSLIPVKALRRWADLMARGAEKYGERNWELGMPTSRYLDSGMRHLFSYLEGDRTEDHLSAVLFNVGAMIHFENTEWDDLNEEKEVYESAYTPQGIDPVFWRQLDAGEFDDLLADTPNELDSDDENLADHGRHIEQLSFDFTAPDVSPVDDPMAWAVPEQNDELINWEKVKQDAKKNWATGPGSPWNDADTWPPKRFDPYDHSIND